MCISAAWRSRRDVPDVIVFPKVRPAAPPSRVSIPLDRLALCLNDDCNRGYEVGTGPCPACASTEFVLVVAFFKPR